MSFYNTNNETGEQLKQSQDRTMTQSDLILEWYENNPRSWSPSQVWKALFRDTAPITSVRRSISDLTNDGELQKTSIMVKGMFGKNEHTWKLAVKVDPDQAELF